MLRDRLETQDRQWRELDKLAREVEAQAQPGQPPPVSAGWQEAGPAQLDRRRILSIVRQTWIAGVLEQSLPLAFPGTRPVLEK